MLFPCILTDLAARTQNALGQAARPKLPDQMRKPTLLCCHPHWLTPCRASVDRLVAKLLLDPHELVVLGIAIRSAWCSGLDLASAQRHSQICDGRVFRIPRAVGAHHTPIALLAELHRVDGFGKAANLVHLEQQRIADLA